MTQLIYRLHLPSEKPTLRPHDASIGHGVIGVIETPSKFLIGRVTGGLEETSEERTNASITRIAVGSVGELAYADETGTVVIEGTEEIKLKNTDNEEVRFLKWVETGLAIIFKTSLQIVDKFSGQTKTNIALDPELHINDIDSASFTKLWCVISCRHTVQVSSLELNETWVLPAECALVIPTMMKIAVASLSCVELHPLPTDTNPPLLVDLNRATIPQREDHDTVILSLLKPEKLCVVTGGWVHCYEISEKSITLDRSVQICKETIIAVGRASFRKTEDGINNDFILITNNGLVIRHGTVNVTKIEHETSEFWDVEDKINACMQGRNELYVADRLKEGLPPVKFVVDDAWKIDNRLLKTRFDRLHSVSDPPLNRVRYAFHGTSPQNIDSIIMKGLLPFTHPLSIAGRVDEGYFGSTSKGIYVSRFADYSLQYSNNVRPLEPPHSVLLLMFTTLPGRSLHVKEAVGPVDPTPGYDSHESPNFLEWYLFDEARCCPAMLLQIRAVEDTATAGNDF